MFYYYVIGKNKVYTITSKKPICDKSNLNDKDAIYLVPINFIQWIYMRIRFGGKK